MVLILLIPLITVALRKESVDRNLVVALLAVGRAWSLSARRAWIEIGRPTTGTQDQYVALRKESVDRNGNSCTQAVPEKSVALRKESVDRNNFRMFACIGFHCRSPQGERG